MKTGLFLLSATILLGSGAGNAENGYKNFKWGQSFEEVARVVPDLKPESDAGYMLEGLIPGS